MTLPQPGAGPTGAGSKREAVLHVMAAAAFLVFFQAYLVAPLIPSLSVEFHASTDLGPKILPPKIIQSRMVQAGGYRPTQRPRPPTPAVGQFAL